ncbi:MAG: ddpC2 [Devosia sp.]|nr:ddpC2 [Devosia sp.]MDB5586440.1 ddpC2 [Devosia sp.]
MRLKAGRPARPCCPGSNAVARSGRGPDGTGRRDLAPDCGRGHYRLQPGRLLRRPHRPQGAQPAPFDISFSWKLWLSADALGRPLLARLAEAASASIGIAAGYFGGHVGNLIMRVSHIVMASQPSWWRWSGSTCFVPASPISSLCSPSPACRPTCASPAPKRSKCASACSPRACSGPALSGSCAITSCPSSPWRH